MMNILGFDIDLPAWLRFLGSPAGVFGINFALWLIIAVLVHNLLRIIIRRLTRFSKTQLDDLLMSIVRRPVVALIVSYGLVFALELAFGTSPIIEGLRRLYRGILIVLLAYVTWRVLYEVVIAYLEPIVRASDSKADDIIIPLLRRIGPVIIIIAVANAVVATLGGNLSTLLAGLGLLGLVLGYLFQEPLQGLFSGTYIALDNPFREDDLIILEDGTTCQVIEIGVRVTQLYDVKRHVVLFLPNARLAGNKIVNLTKPSVEMRTVVQITFDDGRDCNETMALLVEACNGHENILGIWEDKREAILRRQQAYRQWLESLCQQPRPTTNIHMQMHWFRDHIARLDGELIRLQVEHSLRERGERFSQSLARLGCLCTLLDGQRSVEAQQNDIQRITLEIMDEFDGLIEQITVWLYLVKIIETEVTDDSYSASLADFVARDLLDDGKLTLSELSSCGAPGAPTHPMITRDELPTMRSSDLEADRAVDQTQFHNRANYLDYRRLYAIWHRNIAQIYRGLRQIHRLEDLRSGEFHALSQRARGLERQFGDSFLLCVSHWQRPVASLRSINDGKHQYELAFFVDDVVREHFQRSERVTAELQMEIARLKQEYLPESTTSDL